MWPECEDCGAAMVQTNDGFVCPNCDQADLILDQPRPKREDVDTEGLNL